MNSHWLAYGLVLWAGLLIGVAFIATPIKFAAPHLTLPVALEVGKVTFHLFNKVEWVMLVLIMIAAYLHDFQMFKWWVVSILVLLLAIQSFWLLPSLDVRTNQVIAGQMLAPSWQHHLYIIIEVLKLIFLLVGAWYLGCKDST